MTSLATIPQRSQSRRSLYRGFNGQPWPSFGQVPASSSTTIRSSSAKLRRRSALSACLGVTRSGIYLTVMPSQRRSPHVTFGSTRELSSIFWFPFLLSRRFFPQTRLFLPHLLSLLTPNDEFRGGSLLRAARFPGKQQQRQRHGWRHFRLRINEGTSWRQSGRYDLLHLCY